MADAAVDTAVPPAAGHSDRLVPARTGGPIIGLALGAGAARGWSHIGVIERLVEVGMVPDVVAGTSIGALVGGCFAAGRLPELKEFALSLTRRRIFSFLDLAWTGSGLISGDRLRLLLEKQLGEQTFADLMMPFVCIATELETGHEIWLRQGPLADAIRASYALPGLFRPVRIDGQWLIDGAVVNPIPVSACRALGARLVIATNLSSDAFAGTVVQEPAKLLGSNGDSPVGERSSALRQMIGGSSNPGLTTVLVAAFNISQDRLARSRLAGDPPDINIVPRTPGVGLFDFDKAGQAIAAGREAAERSLRDIELVLRLLERAAGT